jgi:hypothetical protein
MLHGFGTDVPAQERAFGKGLADQDFAERILNQKR